MKRFVVSFFSLILLLSVTGCGAEYRVSHSGTYFEATVMDKGATYLLVRPTANYPEAYYADMLQITWEDLSSYQKGDIIGVTYYSAKKHSGEIQASAIEMLKQADPDETTTAAGAERMAGTFLHLYKDESEVHILSSSDEIIPFRFPEEYLDTLSSLGQGDTVIFNYVYSSDDSVYTITDLISVEERSSGQKSEDPNVQRIYAYLANYNEEFHSIQVDWIEWITLKDKKRMENLGLTSEDLSGGSYIYNEKEIYYTYPMAGNVKIELLDSSSGSFFSSSARELGTRLDIEMATGKNAYQVTIIDNIITDISSVYQ